MSEQDQFGPTPEQQAAIEHIVETRGISPEMARRAFFGAKIEPDGPVAAPKGPPKLHPTGHVHDYESDRDHELAAERAVYQPASTEQSEINARGRAMIEKELDLEFGYDRKIKAIEAQVEQEIPIDPDNVEKSLADRERLVTARLYTHFGRKTVHL